MRIIKAPPPTHISNDRPVARAASAKRSKETSPADFQRETLCQPLFHYSFQVPVAYSDQPIVIAKVNEIVIAIGKLNRNVIATIGKGIHDIVQVEALLRYTESGQASGA